MAKVSSGIFQFILIAGALGVVQGLLWLALGIAVVIIKFSITVCQDENLQSDSISIGCAIYNVFIKDGEDDRIINAKGFIIFVYIYLGLSLLWFFVSSFLIWGTLRASNNSKAKNCVWSATTIVISLIDVILMSLLVYDYINYKGGGTIAENVAKGIVLSIAVRGYVLWIINLIFAIILGKSAYNQYRNAPTNTQSYIDAFDTSLRPPWETDNDFQQNMSNGEYNSGFINDTDDTYKSNSFNKIRIGSSPFNNNNNTEANKESTNFSRNPLSNPSNQNWPKIGVAPLKDVNKSTYIGDGLGLSTNLSGRPLSDFPQNTQFLHGESKGADITQLHSRVTKNNDSPYIPDPDYSPPGSPRVKGVLRPRNRGFEATLKNTMTDEYPLVITATPFFAFMIVYLCLSLCLFLNSSFLLWATLSKFNRLYKENVGIWCILTGIISFIDIILMILFAINYAHIKQFQDSHNEGRSPTDAIVRTATVVVMTLSIRGYVLWIINVVFAVLMGCFTYRYYKEDPLLHSHMSSDSYSTSTSSRLANNGDYNSNLIGETYPSSFYSGLRAKLSHSPTAKFIRALNERVVKKCNDNTTPSSSSIQTKNPEQTVYDNVESYIPPPFIPRPDYSPPLSPRTRQLIRQRNNMLQKDFSFNKI